MEIRESIDYRVARAVFKMNDCLLADLIVKFKSKDKKRALSMAQIKKELSNKDLFNADFSKPLDPITLTPNGFKFVRKKIIESIEAREMQFSPSALREFKNYGPRGLISYYMKVWKEKTPDMILGIAFETYALEYDNFYNQFFILDETQRPEPDKDYKTKVNREWKAEIIAANKGKFVIAPETLETIKDVDTQLKITGDFFMDSQVGIKQAELIGEYEGILVMGILDLYVEGKKIWDLKKVQDAKFDRVKWTIINDYIIQGACYWWLAGQNCDVSFICADPSGHVVEVGISEQRLFSEVDNLKALISKLNKAIDTGNWDAGEDFVHGGKHIIF